MRAEFTLPLATLYGFLLVLTRIAAAMIFVPLPGVQEHDAFARDAPRPARVRGRRRSPGRVARVRWGARRAVVVAAAVNPPTVRLLATNARPC